jgi:hypothetical protein
MAKKEDFWEKTFAFVGQQKYRTFPGGRKTHAKLLRILDVVASLREFQDAAELTVSRKQR